LNLAGASVTAGVTWLCHDIWGTLLVDSVAVLRRVTGTDPSIDDVKRRSAAVIGSENPIWRTGPIRPVVFRRVANVVTAGFVAITGGLAADVNSRADAFRADRAYARVAAIDVVTG